MYRRISDFINDWQREVECTASVFSALTNESFLKEIHADVRTLQRIAWHLVETMPEMGMSAGLFSENSLAGVPAPNDIEELVSQYKNYADQLAKAVHLKWTDSTLEDTVEMYGEVWTKGKTLQVFLVHQTHHRGQMTVIMRLLGLEVPNVYGPTKEDWLRMGMPVPA